MTPQPLPRLAAARARAYSPSADQADVQLVVRSSASPFSKVAVTLLPSWHRGRPACTDVSWETVSAAVAVVVVVVIVQ